MNPSSTKQGSTNPVGVNAKLVLQKGTLVNGCSTAVRELTYQVQDLGFEGRSFFLLLSFPNFLHIEVESPQ